ncbi:hypothetical protein SAMN04487819_11686 [Actinopolyspora alba]|uniref:Uncharacterized protein n=1 Tax=Actinopolyspora alba TaxID=673379 RepID=A0A1I2BGM8_9ACTN|nr:hypothetical protein [Actinopolyspora alba]SFE55087.1 hypothetical protein SAMN04487819_11686 [Actinopolyspora alba]
MSDETTDRMWVVLRDDPSSTIPVAVCGTRAQAVELAELLGEPHRAEPDGVPVLPAGAAVRVRQWWSCRATVEDGRVSLGEPFLLPGAARPLGPGEDDQPQGTVQLDEEAAELERAVRGQRVRHLAAYATSAERARELARHRAQGIADQDI